MTENYLAVYPQELSLEERELMINLCSGLSIEGLADYYWRDVIEAYDLICDNCFKKYYKFTANEITPAIFLVGILPLYIGKMDKALQEECHDAIHQYARTNEIGRTIYGMREDVEIAIFEFEERFNDSSEIDIENFDIFEEQINRDLEAIRSRLKVSFEKCRLK